MKHCAPQIFVLVWDVATSNSAVSAGGTARMMGDGDGDGNLRYRLCSNLIKA